MTVRYWSAEAETASADEIARRQRESLPPLMERCANVPHYRAALAAAGVRPGDVRDPADLAAVPFFDKAQLRDLQPWGVLATGLDRVARFHATTGTTGLPCNIAFSRGDLAAIADLGARNVLITVETGCFALVREDRATRRFHAVAPALEAVSAVGAGDVLLAAFLGARYAQRPVAEALASAVAAGAASTLEVGAGRFDPREASRLVAGVELRELEPVSSHN